MKGILFLDYFFVIAYVVNLIIAVNVCFSVEGEETTMKSHN